jgi:hypothetical protein
MSYTQTLSQVPIEANSIEWTYQSRFHPMTREDPSLEMLWLKKHKDNG